MYRQYQLRSDEHRLTCWLQADTRLRPGALVTLRGSEDEQRWWEVVKVHGPVLPQAPHQPWRVGGLL
jgi:hypothetical protein